MALNLNTLIAAVAVSALTMGAAQAQNSKQWREGVFGHIALEAGFANDPFSLAIPAGGAQDAAQMFPGADCRGKVAQAPDFTLDYAAGGLDLSISAVSATDVTLVVRAPDGAVRCDDDSGGDLNPLITFNSPAAGRYQVWVGVYSAESGVVDSTVYVSEFGGPETLRDMGLLNGSGGALLGGAHTAAGEVELHSGFFPDPHIVAATAGGELDVSAMHPQCSGWVPDESNIVLTYESTSGLPLILSVVSDIDTTLLVLSPDGVVNCDDDSGDAPLSPSLRFDNPVPGNYDIWIGAYSAVESGAPAALYISELTTQ